MGKKLALLFSLITHPLLMITYALVIYLKVNPFAFGVPNIGLKMPLVLMVFVLTFFSGIGGLFVEETGFC